MRGRVKDVKGFTALGGGYGTFTIFASLSASYIGGGYSAGNAAEAFSEGIKMTLALFGFSISTILIGRFLVPGVRRFRGAATVGGIIGASYGRAARALTGVFSFVCCAGVVGAQMGAIGAVFNVLLGVPHRLGILVGCGIVLLYSTTGGQIGNHGRHGAVRDAGCRHAGSAVGSSRKNRRGGRVIRSLPSGHLNRCGTTFSGLFRCF